MNVNPFKKMSADFGQNRLVAKVEYAHNIRLKEILIKGGIDRNINSGASNKQWWLYKQSCF